MENSPSQKPVMVTTEPEMEGRQMENTPSQKPAMVTAEPEMERQQSEELFKNMKLLADSITKETFTTVVRQMQALFPIDNERQLRGVVDIVYEKATSGDPSRCTLFANVSRCLAKYIVPSEVEPKKMQNFRGILLTKCQRTFEYDRRIKLFYKSLRSLKTKVKVEEKEGEDDIATEKEEAQEDEGTLKEKTKEDKETKIKPMLDATENESNPENQLFLENLRFIGELFKLKMLTENIMHNIVFKILHTRNPKCLPGLCTLLTTIGRELDTDKAKPRMDQYFNQIGKVVNDKKTIPAMSVMLQELVDLRANHWTRQQSDVHVGTKTRGVGEAVVRPKVKQGDLPSKILTMPKRQLSDSTSRLRRSQPHGPDIQPGFASSKFGTVRKSCVPGFGFVPDGRDMRDSFGYRSEQSAKNTRQSTREKAILLAIQSGNTPGPDENTNWREKSSTVLEVKDFSSTEMEKKTKAVLDEYLYKLNAETPVKFVSQIPKTHHHLFLYDCMNHVLEISSIARTEVGELLHGLVKYKVITRTNYLTGLTEVLDFAGDMEKDNPDIWANYGEMIVPMLHDDVITLKDMKQPLQPLVKNNKAGVLLAFILQDIVLIKGQTRVAKLWLNSGLEWSEIMPEDQIDLFLAEKKLQFTRAITELPRRKKVETCTKSLDKHIVIGEADKDTVLDWTEKHENEYTSNRPMFIRQLMTKICEIAVTGNTGDKGRRRVDPKAFKIRNDLLQKYLDRQPESELQALYAVQAFLRKLEYPPGVLRILFDTLYDEDIISEDAFIQWEKSEDEPEGKKAALKQVAQFFEWLKEAENEY